ncbi:MAG: hypothetical protein K1X53_13095 [Candidatus Sumerlaeaceae bacterium]|nr:hypothetical protein [Candidatus Sumerlaeaceae bacterium]
MLWTLPNTLLGVIIGLIGLGSPEISHGALNFHCRRGIVRAICEGLRIRAFTLGDCVIYAAKPNAAIRAHEYRHVWQYHILGPLFLPVYFLLLAVRGYYNHPLERDARRYEERITLP